MEEIWKSIKNYEGLYEISNLGQVKSLVGFNGKRYIKREKILQYGIDKNTSNNYRRSQINLIKNKKHKTYRVHRLVAEAFLEKPINKNIVNHKDFNALNNNVENLEWCNQYENVQWSLKNNRLNKYIYDKNKAIELYKDGYTNKYISIKLKVPKSIINNLISKNKIYRKIYPRKSKYNISIQQLKILFNQQISNKEISIKYNIPAQYVARRKYQIKKGEI